MINENARTAVESSFLGLDSAFRMPLYGSYNFARLPATLELLLTGDPTVAAQGLPLDVLGPYARKFETVILVFVDGFGWQLFQRFAERLPFLRRFLDQGVVSPMTSQFPSTTAAHMTTLHTGEPLCRTGVWEWYYYDPEVDDVIAPLLYSLATEQIRESLRQHPISPETLLPGPRWYRRLAQQGVRSSVFQDMKYADSVYSGLMFDGATRYGYHAVTTGLMDLSERVLTEHGTRYYYFYIDTIDGRGHSEGLTSPDYEKQVLTTFERLEERLYQPLAGKAGDALLLMSADHGQVSVQDTPPVYVNQLWPDLSSALRQTRTGQPIRFGGSPRDLFLYVREEHLAATEARLRELLQGQALVVATERLLAEGVFGLEPTPRLRERLGNLAILPYAGRSVYWFEAGMFWMKHKGSHGGLTPEEMDTGLYVVPL